MPASDPKKQFADCQTPSTSRHGPCIHREQSEGPMCVQPGLVLWVRGAPRQESAAGTAPLETLPHGLSSTVLSLTSRSPTHSPLGTRKELKQEPPSFTGGDTSAAHPHLTRPPAARLHPALPRAPSPPQHLCWETGSSDGCLAIGGGLTSIILIVLSTVSPQLQGWFVPVSLRPALQTVPAYVTAAVCSSCS